MKQPDVAEEGKEKQTDSQAEAPKEEQNDQKLDEVKADPVLEPEAEV